MNVEEINAVAVAFSDILKKWLSPVEMADVIARNKTPEYKNACATHDYCDANQAMLDGFIVAIGRDLDFESETDNQITNAAWNVARQNNFYI